jgi:hypothetical protein
MQYFAILVLLLFPSIGMTAEIWTAFISSPTKSNYNRCINAIPSGSNIKGSIADKCIPCNDLFESTHKLNSFLKLVDAGNTYALDLSVKLTPFSDGSVKEDICKSIGKNIVSNFTKLIKALDDSKSSNEDIKCMVTTLGEEFADNDRKRIQEINSRIKAVRKLGKTRFSQSKDVAERYLLEYLAKIKKNDKKGSQS